MTKLKLKGVALRTDIDKKGNKIHVLVTAPTEGTELCKGCKKEPRQHGSRTCRKCADGYKKLQFEKARVQRKVDAAIINSKK